MRMCTDPPNTKLTAKTGLCPVLQRRPHEKFGIAISASNSAKHAALHFASSSSTVAGAPPRLKQTAGERCCIRTPDTAHRAAA
jgi:hypothetical protein